MNDNLNKKPNEEYESYDLLGRNYHWKSLKSKNPTFRKYINTILTDLLNIIDRTNSITILDAGCGDGVLLYFLHKNRPNLNLFGFDFIEDAIKYAKKKLRKKAEVFVFDIRNIEKLDRTFDLVICTETIDHVLHPDQVSDPNELRRFHVQILNQMINRANKANYFTIPATEEWRDENHNFSRNNELLLEEWLTSLNYKTNWKYLTTDKKNPQGTYIVEIIKTK